MDLCYRGIQRVQWANSKTDPEPNTSGVGRRAITPKNEENAKRKIGRRGCEKTATMYFEISKIENRRSRFLINQTLTSGAEK